MRLGFLIVLACLAGCASDKAYFESNVDSTPTCRDSRSVAGQYRCEGWALVERSRANGPDSDALKQAAVLRFLVADGIDKGGMTPEQGAGLIGAAPTVQTASY